MISSNIDFHPPDRTLRTFAGLFLVATVVVAGWQLYAHANPLMATSLLTLGVATAALGIVNPSIVRPLYVGMMIVSFPMNWLSSHLLLAATYFTLFTPLALLFRLIKRDPLRLRAGSDGSTYLEARPGPRNHRAYFRPY